MMNESPDDFTQWESNSQISEARRRRHRPGFSLPSKGDRAALMAEIAGRLEAKADFFIFSLLSAGVMIIALLSDAPAIYILAALLAPFLSPVVGLGFATVVGSPRFFIRSLGSFLIASLFMFVGGAVAGWISKVMPSPKFTQLQYHSKFGLADFILLTIGVLLAIYITVKVPKNRSLVASVALAYELLIPISVAGFGVTSGIKGLFPEGLELVGLYLAWLIFLGTIFLAILKIKPYTFFGYFLTAIILGGAAFILLSNSGIGSSLRQQVSTRTPTPTATFTLESAPLVTPTNTPQPGGILNATTAIAQVMDTLIPTAIPTETITPKPTAVYGRVYSSTPSISDVYMWKSPGKDYLQMLPVDTLVEILGTQEVDLITWVHIRVVETGVEGWISRSLLLTATPQVDW
jgi:uncharacterized membrane protein